MGKIKEIRRILCIPFLITRKQVLLKLVDGKLSSVDSTLGFDILLTTAGVW
jgi:hypothetical protein